MMKPQMWEPGMDDEEEIDILDLMGYYMSKQLAGMIGVAVVEDTQIMEIYATSADPQEAMEIANQTAESAKEQTPRC